MSTAGKIVLALAFVLFIAYVVYSSTRLDEYSCDVCMNFNGLTKCASATGITEIEARNSAISVACASISAGVTEGISCGNTPPKSAECRKR